MPLKIPALFVNTREIGYFIVIVKSTQSVQTESVSEREFEVKRRLGGPFSRYQSNLDERGKQGSSLTLPFLLNSSIGNRSSQGLSEGVDL